MIGKIEYYNDLALYIKNNKIQDFLLKCFIDEINNNDVFTEKCLIHYYNHIRKRELKMYIRKEENVWFSVYYIGLIENRTKINAFSDLMSIEKLFDEYLTEVKRIEYMAYQKLTEDLNKTKLFLSKLSEVEVYTDKTDELFWDLTCSVNSIALGKNLYNNNSIDIPIKDKILRIEVSHPTVTLKVLEGKTILKDINITINENNTILLLEE